MIKPVIAELEELRASIGSIFSHVKNRGAALEDKDFSESLGTIQNIQIDLTALYGAIVAKMTANEMARLLREEGIS